MGRRCVAAALLVGGACGYDAYSDSIPNGRNVYRRGSPWRAVGHTGSSGAGWARDRFGDDFERAGARWTTALCKADSDGDGQSNGLELGDPDCVWQVGNAPARDVDISDPGFAESVTLARALAARPSRILRTVPSTTPPPTSTLTLPPTTTTVTTTTPQPIPDIDFSCNPSKLPRLSGGSVVYECSMKLASGNLVLHWGRNGIPPVRRLGSVNNVSRGPPVVWLDMAVEKPRGSEGWMAIGFPTNGVHMVGSFAVVTGGADVSFWRLDGQVPTSFYPVQLYAFPLNVSSASSSTVQGTVVIRLVGVGIADMTRVKLTYALTTSCAFPCAHGSGSFTRGGITLDLITGDLVIDEQLSRNVAIGGLVALTVIAMVSGAARCCGAGGPERAGSCFQPVLLGWSISGTIGFVSVLVVLIAVACVVKTDGSEDGMVDTPAVFSLGRSCGFAACLPIWLAVTRFGADSFLTTSKQVAWQTHAIFGALFLLLGTLHGAFALYDQGFDGICGTRKYLVGFVGLIMMWASVLLSAVPFLAPGRGLYDLFKLLHYLAFPGYCLGFAHMLAVGQTIIGALNVVACAAYVSQKLLEFWAIWRYGRAVVESVEVIAEDGCCHVVLDLLAPSFRWGPGQWALLGVPRLGVVAHPFVVLSGDRPGQARIFAKVCGPFTSGLAALAPVLRGAPATLCGPFGQLLLAQQEWAKFIIFVAGGIGVAPVLSLLGPAREQKREVRLFWMLRKPGLLHACASLLEPHLEPGHRTISVTGQAPSTKVRIGKPASVPRAGAGDAGRNLDGPLPLAATTGRRDVTAWVQACIREAGDAGHKEVLVFICAPPKLAAVARRAANAEPGVVSVVHEESFRFLPALTRKPRSRGSAQKGLN